MEFPAYEWEQATDRGEAVEPPTTEYAGAAVQGSAGVPMDVEGALTAKRVGEVHFPTSGSEQAAVRGSAVVSMLMEGAMTALRQDCLFSETSTTSKRASRMGALRLR